MFSLISMAAHCVSVISTSFVAISIVGMTVSTLPALQYQDDQVDKQIFQISQIFQLFQHDDGGIKYFIFAQSPWKYHTMTKISNQGRTLDNPTLAMVETVSIAWYVGAFYNSTTSKKVEMKLSTRQHNQCIAKFCDIPGSLLSTSSDWLVPRRNVTFSRCSADQKRFVFISHDQEKDCTFL